MDRFIPRRSGKKANMSILLRDNFTISTWLAIGAMLQCIAFSAIGRMAFLPAIGILLYRIADNYAMATGLKHNTYMDGVIMGKVSAQFPSQDSELEESPSDSDICVFILGSKVNHPMGLLAPGYKEIGKMFQEMGDELRENSEKHGFLANKPFMGAGESTNNESISIMYFKSSEHVQAFATGPLHRKAMIWWNKHIAQHPHIGIFHELYHVPKKNYETLYAQMKPVLAGSTKHLVRSDLEKGNKDAVWKTPLVLSKGVLRTSLGRMGRLDGTFVREEMLPEKAVE